MEIDLPNFLLAASVTQAAVFCVFLALPANIGQTSNRLLIVVLLSIAAEYAELFLYGTDLSFRYPNYAYVGTLLSTVQPPAIYLYVKSVMYRGFTLKPRHGVHLLPLLVATVIFMSAYYTQPIEVKTRILLDQDLPGMPTSLPLALIIHGVFLSYLVYSIRVLKKYADGVKDIFSDVGSKQMSWLNILLSGYALIWSISLIYCLSFYIFKCSAEIWYVLLVSGACGLIFINMLVFHGLRQSAVFSGLTDEEAGLLETPEAVREMALPAEEQKDRVERFMEEERPYLNANLSLSHLAKQIGMVPRDLSFIINHGFQKNFFDFVGDYRIRHAAALLDARQDGKTITEVMLESGFNSKSVFNTAFKLKMGMTPTQYRSRGA